MACVPSVRSKAPVPGALQDGGVKLCCVVPCLGLVYQIMTVLKAHYDGRVLVPDEPVDLPLDTPLEIQVRRVTEPALAPGTPLSELAQLAKRHPITGNAAPDLAAQHDHYLYGTPKHE